MDPDHISQGYGKHAVRVVVAEILFGGKRQTSDIIEACKRFQIDFFLLEVIPVKRDMRCYPAQCRLQPVQLKCGQFISGHLLIVIPKHYVHHQFIAPSVAQFRC